MEMVLVECIKCDKLHLVEVAPREVVCSCGQAFIVREDVNVEIVIE